MKRSTADDIAFLLAAVIGVVVLATVFATLYIVIAHPEQDVSKAADAIGRIVAVVIAVLAGYMAGRYRNGANGH